MRKIFRLLAVMLMILAVAGIAWAEEKATKEECVAKVKEAAQMMKDAGVEATLAKINDPKGPFVWKDTYVFCINGENKLVTAHPVQPNLIGKNLPALKDVDGKMFFAEFINVGMGKGEGWVSYKWPKPNEKEPSPKITYVLRVPGQPFIICAGIYE